jgi:Fe2+ or Zn2+ uptake regulation protein
MTRNDKPSFIRLTPQQVSKLEVMKHSIEEPVTRKEIIDGMIDSGYVVALKTLYDAGLVNKKTYEDGLRQVPDYYLGEI